MKEYLASTILRDLEVPFLRSFILDSEKFMAFSKVDGMLLSLDGQKEIHKKRQHSTPRVTFIVACLSLSLHYTFRSRRRCVCYSADFS